MSMAINISYESHEGELCHHKVSFSATTTAAAAKSITFSCATQISLFICFRFLHLIYSHRKLNSSIIIIINNQQQQQQQPPPAMIQCKRLFKREIASALAACQLGSKWWRNNWLTQKLFFRPHSLPADD